MLGTVERVFEDSSAREPDQQRVISVTLGSEMPPINSAHLIHRLRARNADARRDVRLRGIRRYDIDLLLAQIDTLDSVLDLCDVALDQDATRELALTILLKLAHAYSVNPSPRPSPLE